MFESGRESFWSLRELRSQTTLVRDHGGKGVISRESGSQVVRRTREKKKEKKVKWEGSQSRSRTTTYIVHVCESKMKYDDRGLKFNQLV